MLRHNGRYSDSYHLAPSQADDDSVRFPLIVPSSLWRYRLIWCSLSLILLLLVATTTAIGPKVNTELASEERLSRLHEDLRNILGFSPSNEPQYKLPSDADPWTIRAFGQRRFNELPQQTVDPTLLSSPTKLGSIAMFQQIGLAYLFIDTALQREFMELFPDLNKRDVAVVWFSGISIPSLSHLENMDYRRDEMFAEEGKQQLLAPQNGQKTRPELLRRIAKNRITCQLSWAQAVTQNRQERFVKEISLEKAEECWEREWAILAPYINPRSIQDVNFRSVLRDAANWHPAGTWSPTMGNLMAIIDEIYLVVHGCVLDDTIHFKYKTGERPVLRSIFELFGWDYFWRKPELEQQYYETINTLTAFWTDPLLPESWRNGTHGFPLNVLPEVPSGTIRKIGLLMLVDDRIEAPEVWDKWITDANNWSKQLYDSKIGPYSKIDSKFASLLKVHIHVANNSVDMKEKGFSDTFIRGRVPTVKCVWGNLNFCQAQLYRHALSDPAVDCMILVSDSSIPLKPFSEIYKEWEENPRSRFDLFYPKEPLIAKHAEWTVLKRSHVHALFQHQEKWLCDQWLWIRKQTMSLGEWAAPDEYLFSHALIEILGPEKFSQEINTAKSDDFVRLINTAASLPDAFGPVHPPMLHWLCRSNWHKQPSTIEAHQVLVKYGIPTNDCGWLGNYEVTRLASPVTYHTLRESALDALSKTPGVWFLRKVTPSTKVQLDKYNITDSSSRRFSSLIDYYEDRANSPLSVFYTKKLL